MCNWCELFYFAYCFYLCNFNGESQFPFFMNVWGIDVYKKEVLSFLWWINKLMLLSICIDSMMQSGVLLSLGPWKFLKLLKISLVLFILLIFMGETWTWCLGLYLRTTKFDVKSFYGTLRGDHRVGFPWCVRTAAHGKILTMDNLCKWRIIIVDWCCMCKRDGENITTFFFIEL